MLNVLRRLSQTNKCIYPTSGKLFSSITTPTTAADVSMSKSIPTTAQTINTTGQPDKLYKTLDIELKCAEPATIKSYTWFAEQAAKHFGIECKTWSLRKSLKDRLILLKSVHIHKKHRVQYEVRTYYRFMQFSKLTGSTLDTFLEYIERNLPEGVALKATKVELQTLPDYLKKSNVIVKSSDSNTVDKLTK